MQTNTENSGAPVIEWHQGGYVKTAGDPLKPGQQIMLRDYTGIVPEKYEQSEYKGRIVRAWGIKHPSGKFVSLAEILKPEQVNP